VRSGLAVHLALNESQAVRDIRNEFALAEQPFLLFEIKGLSNTEALASQVQEVLTDLLGLLGEINIELPPRIKAEARSTGSGVAIIVVLSLPLRDLLDMRLGCWVDLALQSRSSFKTMGEALGKGECLKVHGKIEGRLLGTLMDMTQQLMSEQLNQGQVP
jgi:hypothetical protein